MTYRNTSMRYIIRLKFINHYLQLKYKKKSIGKYGNVEI